MGDGILLSGMLLPDSRRQIFQITIPTLGFLLTKGVSGLRPEKDQKRKIAMSAAGDQEIFSGVTTRLVV